MKEDPVKENIIFDILYTVSSCFSLIVSLLLCLFCYTDSCDYPEVSNCVTSVVLNYLILLASPTSQDRKHNRSGNVKHIQLIMCGH